MMSHETEIHESCQESACSSDPRRIKVALKLHSKCWVSRFMLLLSVSRPSFLPIMACQSGIATANTNPCVDVVARAEVALPVPVYSRQRVWTCKGVEICCGLEQLESGETSTYQVLAAALKTGGFHCNLVGSMNRLPLIFSFSFCLSRCCTTASVSTMTWFLLL